jgi:hypothetical protein
MASRQRDDGGLERNDGFGDADRARLRRRSLRLHEVAPERVDELIQVAEEVTAEVEAEFQARVDVRYEGLLFDLEVECQGFRSGSVAREWIREQVEWIVAHYEDPSEEIERLARSIIDRETRGWCEEDEE